MPIEDEDHRSSVEQRPRPERGEDPDRERDQHPEDRAAEHERGGDGRGAETMSFTFCAVRERRAERRLIRSTSRLQEL